MATDVGARIFPSGQVHSNGVHPAKTSVPPSPELLAPGRDCAATQTELLAVTTPVASCGMCEGAGGSEHTEEYLGV